MNHYARMFLPLVMSGLLGCGSGHECSLPGATRCSVDDSYPHPHGSLYETCTGNWFDPRILDWTPAYCYALGDGSGPFNCLAPNTVCWSGYCYCGS